MGFILKLFLIRQLPACRIYIFTPASPQPYIYPVFGQIIGKLLCGIFIWPGTGGLAGGIVFDDIDKMGGYLALDLYQGNYLR